MLHQLTSVAPQGKSATWILQQPDSLLGKLLRTVRYQQVFVWANIKPLEADRGRDPCRRRRRH